MVSKCRFLEAILELYNKVKLKTAGYLLNMITTLGNDWLGIEKFKSLVKNLAPEITDEFIQFMYDEALNTDSANANKKQSFVRVLVSYGIGDKALKNFCNKYLAVPGLNSGFDKRRSEMIESLLDRTKNDSKTRTFDSILE